MHLCVSQTLKLCFCTVLLCSDWQHPMVNAVLVKVKFEPAPWTSLHVTHCIHNNGGGTSWSCFSVIMWICPVSIMVECFWWVENKPCDRSAVKNYGLSAYFRKDWFQSRMYPFPGGKRKDCGVAQVIWTKTKQNIHIFRSRREINIAWYRPSHYTPSPEPRQNKHTKIKKNYRLVWWWLVCLFDDNSRGLNSNQTEWQLNMTCYDLGVSVCVG